MLSPMATPLPKSSTISPFTHLDDDHPAQELGRLTPSKLLAKIQEAQHHRDHPRTQVVFMAFYHRYYAYLVKVVSNALVVVQINDRDCIQEIVDDALAAFFRASVKCRVPATADEDVADRIIRSYIGRLAKWKAFDALSFQLAFGKGNLDLEEIDEYVAKQAECGVRDWAKKESEAPDERVVTAIAAWMATLKSVQQDVLRTYFLDDHLGRKSGRLPGGIAQLLAKKHNVTTSAIRYMKINLKQEMRNRFKTL
jgi:hypothetical protein